MISPGYRFKKRSPEVRREGDRFFPSGLFYSEYSSIQNFATDKSNYLRNDYNRFLIEINWTKVLFLVVFAFFKNRTKVLFVGIADRTLVLLPVFIIMKLVKVSGNLSFRTRKNENTTKNRTKDLFTIFFFIIKYNELFLFCKKRAAPAAI